MGYYDEPHTAAEMAEHKARERAEYDWGPELTIEQMVAMLVILFVGGFLVCVALGAY